MEIHYFYSLATVVMRRIDCIAFGIWYRYLCYSVRGRCDHEHLTISVEFIQNLEARFHMSCRAVDYNRIMQEKGWMARVKARQLHLDVYQMRGVTSWGFALN